MAWNFDMTQAPRGHMETVTRTVKGKEVSFEQHVPETIIATDGKIVTLSRWIPPTDKSPGRWNMFATNETPMAWQPWPDPPEQS